VCRNIKPLFNFEPPATELEIHDASLQFVRKVAGSTKPSKANAVAYDTAVEKIFECVQELLLSLSTSAPAKDREIEAARVKLRAAKRFHTSSMAN
jgi:hypothetical protein